MTSDKRKSGTDVKTGTAAYTVEHLIEIGLFKNFPASRIIEYYAIKIFLSFFVRFLINGNLTGTRIHRYVCGNSLGRTVPRQGLKDPAGIRKRFDEFLDTENIQMRAGKGSDHSSVSFVRHRKYGSRFGNCNVSPGNTHLRSGKLIPHNPPGSSDFFQNNGFVFDLRIIGKKIGDLFFVQVQCRHNHVYGGILFQRNNKLSKVGFLNQNTVFF